MSDLGSTNYSETDASNNAAVPNGWPEGMNPSDANNAARANMGATKRFWNRSNSTETTTGTSTAYLLTYDVAAASYYDGEEFSFVVNATCGAAPTLNINSLGAKNLRKLVSGAWANLAAGDIIALQPIRVRYNLADDKFDVLPAPLVTFSTTQAVGDSTTAIATTAFVQAAVAKVYVQTFTASGTYTPHAGMVKCILECWGGGGGGGGVDGLLSYSAASGGAGGVAGTGDTALAGQPGMMGVNGHNGVTGWPTGGAGGATSIGGGAQARSQIIAANTAYAGNAAPTNTGGGGGGAMAFNTNTDQAGGAGSAGYVRIIEFCNQ